jgi:glycine/D-amino acid oxidase-like deaminating enzyme
LRGQIIRERIKRYNIQCDLQGGVFAAETEKQLHELKAQQARWEKWGNDKLELLDADGVREVVASDRYVGALLDKSGGHIHPSTWRWGGGSHPLAGGASSSSPPSPASPRARLPWSRPPRGR